MVAPQLLQVDRDANTVPLCSLAMWRTALSKDINLALFMSTSLSQNV